jgi:DHA2 family methylenomycin A resistance protein-like MFS transporter
VIGQAAAVVGMGGLTYGVIEAGGDGAAVWKVRSAFAVALFAAIVFLLAQARASHPMVPLGLLRARPMVIASFTGFAFLGSFTGTVFVYSLYLQDVHGQSSLATGLEFLPMAVLAGIVSVLGGRLSERFGPRPPIIVGMAVMGVESIVLAALPVSVPIWAVSVLMIPLGASGPLAIPATTAVLLESVPAHRSGIAAGVFNTSRQVGAALAVAVFGALLADRAHFERGLRESLLIAAAVSLAAAAVNTLTRMPVREVVPALPGQAGGARLASTSEGREP